MDHNIRHHRHRWTVVQPSAEGINTVSRAAGQYLDAAIRQIARIANQPKTISFLGGARTKEHALDSARYEEALTDDRGNDVAP